MTRSSKKVIKNLDGKIGRPTREEAALRELRGLNEAQHLRIVELLAERDKLKKDIDGYRTVISYLEFHAGLRDSQ